MQFAHSAHRAGTNESPAWFDKMFTEAPTVVETEKGKASFRGQLRPHADHPPGQDLLGPPRVPRASRCVECDLTLKLHPVQGVAGATASVSETSVLTAVLRSSSETLRHGANVRSCWPHWDPICTWVYLRLTRHCRRQRPGKPWPSSITRAAPTQRACHTCSMPPGCKHYVL